MPLANREHLSAVCGIVTCVAIYYEKGASGDALLRKENLRAQVSRKVRTLKALKETLRYVYFLNLVWIWLFSLHLCTSFYCIISRSASSCGPYVDFVVNLVWSGMTFISCALLHVVTVIIELKWFRLQKRLMINVYVQINECYLKCLSLNRV